MTSLCHGTLASAAASASALALALESVALLTSLNGSTNGKTEQLLKLVANKQ